MGQGIIVESIKDEFKALENAFNATVKSDAFGIPVRVQPYGCIMVFYTNQSYGGGIACLTCTPSGVNVTDIVNTFNNSYTATWDVSNYQLIVTAKSGIAPTLEFKMIGSIL